MRLANQQAGRTPAPRRNAFAKELAAIDPAFMARLLEREVGDQDARDIVKKFSYLGKIAASRPQVVMEYIANRCPVLLKYGVLSKGLIAAATKVAWGDGNEAVSDRLLSEIELCHPKLREPLRRALTRHPLVEAKQVF